MSGSGEIYTETSSDILAQILRKINQELVYAESLNNPISDVEQLSIGRTVDSETETNDKMSHGLSRLETDQFYMPLEPYPNLKAWLKFDSGITCKDYAYNDTVCKTDTVRNQYSQKIRRPLKRRTDDDAVTEGPVYSITNGLNQFFRVENAGHLKIQNILSSPSNIFQFSMIVSPMFYYTPEVGTDFADAISYIDNDQADNGVRVSISGDGRVKFRLIWEGQAYEVETQPDAVARLYITPFQTEVFQSSVFQTEAPDSPQQNPDLDPTDWTMLTFVFRKDTRQLVIKKTDILGVSTVLATSADQSSILSNVSMYLPANEGGNTATLFDRSGNGNNGTFADDPDAPSWLNGFLHFAGDTARATIANAPEIDTLSVFTIAFKIRLTSYPPTAFNDVIVGKDVTTDGMQINSNGGFVIYIVHETKDIKFRGKTNAGTEVTFWVSNGIPLLNQWYDVVITYNGSQYILDVLGVGQSSPWVGSGHVYTNASDIVLGHAGASFQGDIADVTIVKGTAWNTSQKAVYAARQAGFKAGFPVYHPPPPPPNDDPVVITAPWTKLYNIDHVETNAKALKINSPTAASPFVPVFTVPIGQDIVDPEVIKYDVPDGTQGGSSQNPWYTAYSLTPANSTGSLDYDEDACGQYVLATGSNIYNRKLTEIGVYLKKGTSAPSGGTLYIGIMKQDGTYIAFGAGINPTTLPTDWTLYTVQNFTAQYAVQVGDCVGIIWVGGSSGTVNIQRNTTPYEDETLSCQGQLYDEDWHTNPSYHIAGLFRYGGETVTGTNPFHKMGSTNNVLAVYQLNSTIEGIIPTRHLWRVRRVGTAASAVVSCTIRNASNAVIFTFPNTFAFNSISTSVQDLEFIDRNNKTIGWADGYRLCLQYANQTGINDTTNYLEVNYNTGEDGTGYVGGTAIRAQKWKSTIITGWSDVSPVSDWAGKVCTGGNDFTAYWELGNGARTQAGIVVNETGAVTAGKTFSKFDVVMKKFGNPAGPITLKIYQKVGANYELRATFNSILAESLTTDAATYTFTFVLNAYQTGVGDLIAVEYTSGDANNYVLINRNTNAAAGAAGDGTKTCLFDLWNGNYYIKTDLDLCVTAYTGGVPDLVSRSKRAFVCNSEEAPIRAKRITSVTVSIRRVGNPTGMLEVWAVRGSDYTNVFKIGQLDVSTISAAPTFQEYWWDNINNTHYMGLSDKISVQYEGGDQNNYIEIEYIDNDATYSDTVTTGDYDGIIWRNDETKYLAGELWTGGYTYIQDPSIPPIPDPNAYQRDWLIGAGGFIPDGEVPTSYYGMRIRDFRIVAGEEYSLAQLSSIMLNKFTAADILLGQVGVCGYSTADESDPNL